MEVARLAVESGLFPLFEAEDGELTAATPLRRRVPVTEYLRIQKRFAHLFHPAPDEQRLGAIQRTADRNIARFNLAPVSPVSIGKGAPA